jgi:hypothetical protein
MARLGGPAGWAKLISDDRNKRVRPAHVLGGGAQLLLPCRARARRKDLVQGRRADLHQGRAAEVMRVDCGALGGCPRKTRPALSAIVAVGEA